MRSSDEDDGFRSLGWHGDFDTFTLGREPGREAGGVADRPVVEPGMARGRETSVTSTGNVRAKEERNRIRGEGDRRKGIKSCVVT